MEKVADIKTKLFSAWLIKNCSENPNINGEWTIRENNEWVKTINCNNIYEAMDKLFEYYETTVI